MRVAPHGDGVDIFYRATPEGDVQMRLGREEAALLIWAIAASLCPELPTDYAGPAARQAAERKALQDAERNEPHRQSHVSEDYA